MVISEKKGRSNLSWNDCSLHVHVCSMLVSEFFCKLSILAKIMKNSWTSQSNYKLWNSTSDFQHSLGPQTQFKNHQHRLHVCKILSYNYVNVFPNQSSLFRPKTIFKEHYTKSAFPQRHHLIAKIHHSHINYICKIPLLPKLDVKCRSGTLRGRKALEFISGNGVDVSCGLKINRLIYSIQ